MSYRSSITSSAALIAAGIFIVSLAIGMAFRHHYWDDPFIVSVYARNLIRGNGLVFNHGERVLGITTPLYTLVVALTGLFFPDIPTLSCIISAFSTALLGIFIFYGATVGEDWIGGAVCAALVILSANSYMYVGIETYFYAMLVYGSFCLFCHGNYGSASVLAALGVLARPDGVLAALILLTSYLVKERRFPATYSVLFLLITLPWAAFAYYYYGDILPQTFYAKKGSISHHQYLNEYVIRGIGGWIFSRNQQNLPFPPFILPVIGLVCGARRSLFLRLSYIHAIAMIAGYVIISPEDPWHSYPVMVAAFLSLGFGIYQVADWVGALFKPWAYWNFARAITASLLALPILLWQFSDLENIRDGYAHTWLGGPRHKAYVQTAQWLNNNAAPGATVLTLEPGTMAFYSKCVFYDYWGLISRKGWKISWRDAPRGLRPDYIIWNNAEKEDAYPVPDGYILRRVIEVSPFPRIFISEKRTPLNVERRSRR